MAKRLTTFSKLLITFLILAAIFFGFKWLVGNTGLGELVEQAKGNEGVKTEATKGGNTTTSTTAEGTAEEKTTIFGKKSNTNASKAKGSDDDNTLKVQLVSWGGYAPGLYFNEGAAANERSRYLKEYGFKVDFKLENDLINALDAWLAGEYDVIVQTADAFPLYTAPDDINAVNPRAFMQVDWSRGGDAIIVKRGINTINDLKGKKIVVAVPSPAQTLLITSLEAAGLKYSDVEVIKTTDNLKAAELFRSDEVDAAVVWSPDDILATRDVAGSKILLTTMDQTHVIADIMLAKQDVIDSKRDMINKFYEGWMKGVAEIKMPANEEKAAKYLAELNGVSVDDAKGMMSVVHWTSHGDNMNFFGLNPKYKGQKGNDLYGKMAKEFVKTGDAEKVAPSWRSVIYTGAVQNAESALTSSKYGAEKSKVFTAPTAADKKSTPVATKPVSINFSTGQYQLTENAKTIIDLQFADVAKAFAGMKVRIEGNTDNVGSLQSNVALSQKRAQAVADYLRTTYSMDGNRFVIVGNGPNKPVKGCETNATADCQAKNRRTDFQLIPAG